MSLLGSTDRIAGPGAAAAGFYARAVKVNTGLLSKKVGSVDVDILAGTVRKGDPLELIRSDGSAIPAIVDRMFASDVFGMHSETVVLHDFGLTRDEVGALELVREPGLAAPRLPGEEERPGTGHLLDAVRAARREGFPAPAPEQGIAEILAKQFLEALPRLPDEAVVLTVQNRLAQARARTGDAHNFESDCRIAAVHLGAIGLQEDGDRLLLQPRPRSAATR